jgi:hypothetical protein
MQRRVSGQSWRMMGLAVVFALGFSIASPGGDGARRATPTRYLQIHPYYTTKLAQAGRKTALVNIDVGRIPPGWRIAVKAPVDVTVRGRKTGALVVFAEPVDVGGNVEITVTRPRLAHVVWFGFHVRVSVTSKGPVADQRMCVTTTGRLHALPCPRPQDPSTSSTTPPPPAVSSTASTTSTTATTPTPPPPTTTSAPTGDTSPPSVPGGLSASGATTSSVNLAWSASADNRGVTGYNVLRNGTKITTVTGTSYSFTGLACGTSYTLGVSAYDAAGNTSAVASVGASTAGCPPPPPSVSASKGAQHNVSGCSSSACAWVSVTLSNFSGGSHSVTCYADNFTGGFYTYSAGNGTSNVCVYGYPGHAVWVVVDGTYRSNNVGW